MACSRQLSCLELRNRTNLLATLVSKGFHAVSGQKKAGDNFPGFSDNVQTNYRLILRRRIPIPANMPEPRSASVPGSGTELYTTLSISQ